ncbi:MAG: cytochrome c3 family protein [Opitutae bacterium]|nr:cytochrome c3 family protein [Opitutae bacterium]
MKTALRTFCRPLAVATVALFFSLNGRAGDKAAVPVPTAEPAKAVVAPGAAESATPALVPNSECMDCHEAEFKARKKGQPKEWVGVKPEVFAKSVHGKLNCVDCHADIKESPHDSKVAPAQCASCHEKPTAQFATSIHGMSHKMGSSDAASCQSCHGTHDMVPVKQIDSPVFKLNLTKTCGTCHDDPKLAKEYRMGQKDAAAHYLDSIHGQALILKGLIVAPSCNDCHGVHDIKRSVDKDSHTSHANIAKSCGNCHLGIEEIYNKSVHGQLLAKGDKKGPVCTDCHSAHDIAKPKTAHFKEASDQSCGKCHEDRLEHYRDTYHGKSMALGRPNVAPDVAACYDCHGHHDVFPVSDARSRLSKEKIVGTCSQCHAGATEKFTQFQAHANPMDAKNYPILNKVFIFMTCLLVGTFAFFGLHTLLWLVRSVYLYLNDSKTFREAVTKQNTDDVLYTRFTPFERFLHMLVVTSFLLLVITGMPLKFYYAHWAKVMMHFMGGAEVARTLHHFGAIMTFGYFALHLSELAASLWQNRKAIRNPETGRIEFKRIFGAVFGPDSMAPSFQDWRDFVAHNRWFFGKGPRPQFDRWTYWERFDYLAVFWGVAMIGVSGMILWFPKFFTHFMPGWAINIAHVIHSDEALLAAGFIFTFHFFNTHFRIEKFPMDTVIFSGRISQTEMLHERKRWYDRLVAAGKLDDYKVKDEWQGRKKVAQAAGFLFFGTGLVLLVLIVYAMVSRLLH